MLARKKLHGSYENEKGRLIIILVFKTKIFMDPLKIARSSENLVLWLNCFPFSIPGMSLLNQFGIFRIKTWSYILLKSIGFWSQFTPTPGKQKTLWTIDCAQITNIVDVLSSFNKNNVL